MDQPVMADTSTQAVINAPIDSIDVTEWVFGITDAEYQACSRNHIAAAATTAPDGRRMLINVEHVGQLIVQHYVEDLAERGHCRLVSLSDTFGPTIDDRGTADVLWEFWLEPIDAQTTRFTNHVLSKATPGWEKDLAKAGLSLQQAQQQSAIVIGAHNAEETPLFAIDIERKARAGRWSSQPEDPGRSTVLGDDHQS